MQPDGEHLWYFKLGLFNWFNIIYRLKKQRYTTPGLKDKEYYKIRVCGEKKISFMNIMIFYLEQYVRY